MPSSEVSNEILVREIGLYKGPGHERATRVGLQSLGFSQAGLNAIIQGNLGMDAPVRSDNWFNFYGVLFSEDSPEHGMPHANLSAILGIVNSKLFAAACSEQAGDQAKAMRLLGEALHTVQDKWAHKYNEKLLVGGTLLQHYLSLGGLIKRWDPEVTS
jgi:hypothetical protein